MEKDNSEKGKSKLSASFITGAVALAFLAIGYQTALFVHRAAVISIAAGKDSPDTVFVETVPISGTGGSVSADGGFSTAPYSGGKASSDGNTSVRRTYRKDANHGEVATRVREKFTPRVCENFPFDPNTISISDLQRLGFSLRQAEAIDNYRKKGGRFRRKEDFAKSYVVDDTVYSRLEPYISIPRLDINAADSAEFEALPGIGPYFASRMVSYRSRLGGYSYLEQLLDINHFDEEKLKSLSDLITVGACKPYPLWTAPADSLSVHPYIGRQAARGVVLFRENNPKSEWTVKALAKAGVITQEAAGKLSRCRIAEP
jgi:DNA uptake protein ComE-like DNA-binding protein